MPKTREAHKRSLQDPALCELLPIRDFLDNVMVRTDGCYVAGFRMSGTLTYFADDEGRNETKELVEALLRTVPEQSMRLQFRYEVVEGLNGLVAQYEEHRRTENPEALVLEQHRVRQWRENEARGEYLTRLAAAYLIWDPEKHRRLMAVAGGQMKKSGERKSAEEKPGFSLSMRKCMERSKKEHTNALAEFESITSGVESSLKRAAMGPERMTHDELFLEIKRALNPNAADTAPLRDCELTERYVSTREQASTVSILGDAENYINVDGVLWSLISLKTPPDATHPGILRILLTVGFPLVLSTQVTVPDQRAVLDKYKKRLKKMQAAQIDSKGNHRVDIEAQVATQDTRAARREIHGAFHSKTGRWTNVRYWLDIGNNASNGQFVLGQPLNNINRASSSRLRTVTELFPSIMDTSLGEGPLPSCSAAEALERQEPFINNVLATSALAMMTRLLRYGTLDHQGAFYNAESGKAVPIPIDPEMREKQVRRQSRLAKAA